MNTRSLLSLAVAALAAAPAALGGQTPLPMGSTAPGRTSEGGSGTYVFQAPGAGFLTVVVRSEGGADVALSVTDEELQVLPGGSSDQDLGGDLGAEQILLVLPRAGRYLVTVEPLGGGEAAYQIGATFLAAAMVAAPPDPDGRPSQATSLAVGTTHEDDLAPSEGDHWDWFALRVDQDGVLTVLTRSDGEGDLRLELFRDGDFREPASTSDQDMDGVLGNESVAVDVRAGETVYVRVRPTFEGSEPIAYRVGSGLIPG